MISLLANNDPTALINSTDLKAMPRPLDPTKRKLTDAHCKNAQPKPTENGELRTIKLSDGYGLNLEVRRDGKFWFYAYRLYGKQLKLSLGSYPNVKLSDAREMHEKAWLMTQMGEDPRDATITRTQLRKAKQIEQEVQQAQQEAEAEKIKNTFKTIAEQWLMNKEPTLSTDTLRRRNFMLRNDVFPVIGHRQITELKVKDILEVLTPISDRGATFQAKRCRELLQQIFNYARALEHCEHNPVEAIRHIPALRTHKQKSYNALKFREMGVFISKLRELQSIRIAQSRPALQLLILTAVRPGNIRMAHWDQFQDLRSSKPTWVIPAAQMKKARDHLVPLSHQAVELLKSIRAHEWGDQLLFPGEKGTGLINGTFKRQLSLLGYSPEKAHPHGFRSTFSTYANESGLWNRDAIEWVLAHSEKNEVCAAYNRTEYLDDRTEILQWWADELDRAVLSLEVN